MSALPPNKCQSQPFASWCSGPSGRGQRCKNCQALATKIAPLPAASAPIINTTNNATNNAAQAADPIIGMTVDTFTVQGRLGSNGSYKRCYTLNDAAWVLIVAASDRQLAPELQNLQTLEEAGVRVPRRKGAHFPINSECGVIMERLEGIEIKETYLNLVTGKTALITATQNIGVPGVIQQLRALQAFIDKTGGIGDLQFFASPQSGMVLFDPTNLGATAKQDLSRYIRFLEEHAAKVGNSATSTDKKDNK